jgi:outer membrane murein-binding lipoprotein Lpp
MNYDTPGLMYDSPTAFYDAGPATIESRRMAKIKLELKKLTITELIEKASQVGTAMNGNAAFSGIAAQVTAFNTAVGALSSKQTAYVTAKQAADEKLTERDNQRVTVENLMRQLASASEGVTLDGATLRGVGWELRGVAEPVGPLPAPQNLAATGGDLDGTADCQWDSVRGADSYIAECASNPTGPWTQVYVGRKSSCTASGLTGGQLYYFHVRAVGAAGPGPWSDIAQKRAT